MKKILITGVAGFIGSNLADFLLDRGYYVVGVDNFIGNLYSPKIKRQNLAEIIKNPNFKLYEEDLNNFESVGEIFNNEKFDTVVHLAAYAGVTDSFERPIQYLQNNELVTANIILKSLSSSVRNILFASTSSIYGKNLTPFNEEMSTDRPLAPYPATKKASEVLMATYSENTDLNFSIFRFFNPLDIRIRPDLALSKLVRSVLTGEEFPQYQDLETTGRDYCYLQDMFVAMEYSINNPFKYEIFNLGNSSPVTLGKLVSTVEEISGKKVNLVRKPDRKGEMVLTFADVTKAKNLLGYTPQTTIEQIVKKYYEWYLKQPEWYIKGEY